MNFITQVRTVIANTGRLSERREKGKEQLESTPEYICSSNLRFTKKSNNSGEKWHLLGLKSFLSNPDMRQEQVRKKKKKKTNASQSIVPYTSEHGMKRWYVLTAK